ncbi:hypothetical protein [Sandarakinorhabdus rubra]|nr:hypothetical protein [Sandarakinorhabdus rubra]
MKVIQTEYEPQVRAVPAGEAPAPMKPLRRRPRVMLTPAAVENRLFHAL